MLVMFVRSANELLLLLFVLAGLVLLLLLLLPFGLVFRLLAFVLVFALFVLEFDWWLDEGSDLTLHCEDVSNSVLTRRDREFWWFWCS